MATRTARSASPAALVRGSNGGSKLAASVASRIVDDVVARGWPVGTVLGSEADLLDRYQVSRAVFREAVRLVEHQQVARMRRGPGGGLVVSEPSVDAIIDAAVVYLHRVNARLDEVFEARLVLEEIVTDLAPDELDEEDLTKLRALIADEEAGRVADHRAFHTLLASITRNPALELFVDIMNRVSTLYFSDRRAISPGTAAESRHAHARIAEAVLAGDPSVARRRMRRHLEAEADFLRNRRRTVQQLLPGTVLGAPESSKRAEAVARTILQDVIASGAQPGDLLGSEADLMERHGVSRAVFREAVRLLEHHRIAAMRRGPGGGLFVVPPDPGAVTDVVALYLARKGLRIHDLGDLRSRLELVLVDLAVANLDDTGVERLEAVLAREQAATDEEYVAAVHDLHAEVASLAGNRALELIALVLLRLTRLHQSRELPASVRRRIKEEVCRTHAGIAAAITERDAELARNRMRHHLQAVTQTLT
jgi:DNA-binding FadR family transcriptional regulator